MNTFKYKKGDKELFIYERYGEMHITVESNSLLVNMILDQVGLDALRNYLDDLETEE